jgi:hypothetical protein
MYYAKQFAFLFYSLLLVACEQTSSPDLTLTGLENKASYFLTAKHSGLNLDVPGGQSLDGLGLQQYTPNSTLAQQFVLEAVGANTWKIVNQATGKALEVSDGTLTLGAQVQQWAKADIPWQTWRLREKNGDYIIKNVHTGLVLDVFENNLESGAKVIQWFEHGEVNQLWKLTKVNTATHQEPDAPAESAPAPAEPIRTNSVQTIIDDMTLPHEGKLRGVPDGYNWSSKPRVGMGNNPEGFQALIAWGQLYEAAEGNPARNSRVQLKDIRTWILSKRTNTWSLVQTSAGVNGGAYREDYQNNVNVPAEIRPEVTGGVSVTAGNGYNFHFWPTVDRATIDPNDIKGVFTTVQARLVLNDPDGPDDRAEARYLLGMGADYWRGVDGQWDNFKTNGDVGIGRHRFVSIDWQSFNMTSVPAEELRLNPPPLE